MTSVCIRLFLLFSFSLFLAFCYPHSAHIPSCSPLHKNFRNAQHSHNFRQSRSTNDSTQWFTTQRLNHFDMSDARTWRQRYQVNDTYFDSENGGPIFLFLAGEAPMEFFEFQEVQALVWAKQFSALYVSLEHRFYGSSNPLPDLSTSSLRYLSSQQALADAAYFLEWFNQSITAQYGKAGPWVVFGCSYSGALSAWFRAKYPDLVVASVAPSGPVFAVSNFSSYLTLFPSVVSQACNEAASQGASQIAALMEAPSGLSQLTRLFNSCRPIQQKDSYYFLESIIDAIGGADQMSNPPTWGLNVTCDILTNGTDYLANYINAFNYNMGTSSCNDFSVDAWLAYMKSTATNNEGRSWYWQSCVEFGYFQGSYPGAGSIFPFLPVDQQVEWCSEIFSVPGMKPNTEWTNSFYGGYNLQASNVMFTNGLKDPWHQLSITAAESGVEAVTYEAGHCATMIAATSIDPPSLVQARESVTQFLQNILMKI